MYVKTMVVLVIIAALAGCGRDGPAEPAVTLAPSYSAVSADGASLPAVVQEAPYREELLGGTLQFAADGSCSLALDVRTTQGDGTPRQWRYGGSCTYTSRAGSVWLDVERIGPFEFRPTGDRLVMLPAPGGEFDIVFAPTTE